MLDILSRAKNAIEAYNAQLRVSSANIANMSTPGYKSIKVSFQTIYERLINSGTKAAEGSGGTNPVQFGSNVGIANFAIDFSQGSLTEGGHLDASITGRGLFAVSPDGGKTMLYSRTGKFRVDNAGNLVMDNGMQVYGFSSGNLVPITGLSGYNTATLSWATDGRLVEYTDNTYANENRDTGITMAFTSFTNLTGLAQAQGNTFSATESSGPALAFQATGGDFGVITPRTLEQSNVFYTGEVIDSMEAQRAMSGNLTIVRMINDEITNFISRLS